MAVGNQTQFAAVLIPILGLLIVSAVNSVDECEKGWKGWYRPFVFTLSIATIGPIAIASILSIISVGVDVDASTVLFHSTLSISLALILIVGVTIRETMRGMDEDDFRRFYLGLLILVIYYLLIQLFGP